VSAKSARPPSASRCARPAIGPSASLRREFPTRQWRSASAILTDVFGFREVAREGSVIRFVAPADANGSVVDIHEAKELLRGHQGRGSVHHIAFRAADDAQQAQMAEKLIRTLGCHPTEPKDASAADGNADYVRRSRIAECDLLRKRSALRASVMHLRIVP
jgi:hypothetical protein